MITLDDALYWERKYGVGYAFNRLLDLLPAEPTDALGAEEES